VYPHYKMEESPWKKVHKMITVREHRPVIILKGIHMRCITRIGTEATAATRQTVIIGFAHMIRLARRPV
jgi:predicted membrane-bound mannosyltransferase